MARPDRITARLYCIEYCIIFAIENNNVFIGKIINTPHTHAVQYQFNYSLLLE